MAVGTELAEMMDAQKVNHVLAFKRSGEDSQIAVRTENGMEGLDGERAWTPDSGGAVLNVFAKPKPLAATRLETIMASRTEKE